MDQFAEDTAGAVASYLNPDQGQPAIAARSAMQLASDTTPDLEIELRRASARTGVPLEAARDFPEEVKKEAAAKEHDFDEMAAQFPGTTKFLSNPDNARIVRDDIQSLTSSEATIGPIIGPKPTFFSVAGSLMRSLPNAADATRQGLRVQIADLFRFSDVRDDALAKASRLSLEDATDTPDFVGSTARGVYGGAKSTIRMLPAVAAAVATRSSAPLLTMAGVQTEAEAYSKYRLRGATAGEAFVGAAGEGAIEVGTEMLPMGFLVKNMGKVGAGQFLTGLLAREIPSEQLATLTQDAIDTAIANPDKTWKEYAAERGDAAYQTLLATITQATIMAGASSGMRRISGQAQAADHATLFAESLKQLNDIAAASKVRERDASTAQTFFQSLMQDGRDTVWITPQALAESGMLEQVSALPGVSAQLEQASITGAEIRIPIADLMANLSSPELANSIIPHLADEPGGFTQITANEYMQSGQAQELADEVTRELGAQFENQDFNASREVVSNNILEQLNAAGRFSPDVNQAYASMVGNFYAVQGAKLGITPEEMAARYPLQVKAERMAGAKTLDQAPQPIETRMSTDPIERSEDDQFMLDFATPKQANDTTVRAVIGGQEVGYLDLAVAEDGKTAKVRDVKVDPAHRRKGVATALYDAARAQGFQLEPGDNQTQEGAAFRQAYDSNTVNQGERGSLSFADDITSLPSVISLFRNADLSTFLHESGHFFLEVMSDIASRPNAPADIAADMEATLQWFGVPDLATWNSYDIEQKRASHEQFARGFEAYLFEGNAPTPELAGLFDRFRSWLVRVYQSLTALNVELTPEVRGVFDRMLASAEAIDQAQREEGFAGMFGTRPDFMTEEEWNAYRALNLDASQDAVHALETRSLRDMQWLANARADILKKMQRQNAERRQRVREQVTEEVMSQPVNVARTFFSRGLNPDGTKTSMHKLSIEAMIEMYGGEGDKFARLDWEPLGYGKYGALATEGLSPDVAAELLGFESGDAMVREMLEAPPAKQVISDLTDQRMMERYGDLTDEPSIERAIAQALHTRAHNRFLATELNALRKASGSPAILGKAAQAYAERIVRRTVVRELRPDLFTAAARRAARAADKAFKAGDIQEAAAQKQIQLINSYAAKAAIDAREEVQKTATRFQRIANGSNEKASKTRDMEMVQATRAILAEFGIGTRGAKAAEYLVKVQAYDPALAAILRDRIDAATANAKPINQLTVDELGALKDEVESLWFLAKRSRQSEVDGDLIDRQEIQETLRDRMQEIGIPETVPGDTHAITKGEVFLSRIQSMKAALRRVEAWADLKDGDAKMGPFRKFIWTPIKDAADAYRADKAKFLRKYRETLTEIAPTLTKTKIAAPELGYAFGYDNGGMGKMELLHAILHTGNAGNKKKLLLGRNWASVNEQGELDTSKWDAFINRMITEGVLKKADFDFAQKVWDLLEEMKPAAQKTHRQVFGRYFDEVTADAFTTPWGTYRGGYVPAITDTRIVSDAKTRAIIEDQMNSSMNILPSTSKGFTKSRVEYNQPLLLDLRLLSQHIDKVLLFTHLEAPVADVRRILGSDTVSRPLNRIDPSAYDGLLTPWLKRTALQQVETPIDGSNGTMRFFSVLRQRAGMAAMFANVSNTAQQVTGFSIAALKVKPKYLISGAAEYLRNPREMAAAVAANSAYMANRMENEVGAMTGAINEILLNPGLLEQAQGWALKHTYFLQSAVDNVMGPIIWTGAYTQALETAPAGMSEPDMLLYARRLADSAVRETQGSTLPEDIARFETGNAFYRIFTQFAGYFNMQANILGTEYAKVIRQDTGLDAKAGKGLYVLMFGFLAPAWVSTAIALAFRGGPDDEDKDGQYLDDWIAQTFGWGTIRSATALVPVVGQIVNAASNRFNQKPYDDRISTGAGISFLESATAVPGDIWDHTQGRGKATKTVRDVASLLSLISGLPISGAARPLNYAVAVSEGAKPTGAVDAARGAITGVASPASKGR